METPPRRGDHDDRPKGPLAQAGFEVGDIILQIDGETVAGAEALVDMVSMLPPGQKIAILAADLEEEDGGDHRGDGEVKRLGSRDGCEKERKKRERGY